MITSIPSIQIIFVSVETNLQVHLQSYQYWFALTYLITFYQWTGLKK